jgi:hypothetical protein
MKKNVFEILTIWLLLTGQWQLSVCTSVAGEVEFEG